MGFLDKAVKAAGQAKSQLGEVRAQREEASIQPVERALDEHEAQALQRAMANGLPDPFMLISAAEASEVLGVPLGRAGITGADDSIGPRYEARGRGNKSWMLSVSFLHGYEGQPFEAREYWRDMVEGNYSGSGAVVDELGDAALYDANILFVLADPLVFYVEARTPEGDVPPGVLAEAARRVLSRLR